MKNVTLIGMSGVGKSTVGKLYAMGIRQFFDTDTLIQEIFSKPHQQVLEELGPDCFLEEEGRIIREYDWPKHRCFVIAPGGSVVYLPETMKFLHGISTVVYLEATLAVIAKRVDFENRGIVCKNRRSIKEEYNERQDLYKKWSDHSINADDSPSGIARSLMRVLDQ